MEACEKKTKEAKNVIGFLNRGEIKIKLKIKKTPQKVLNHFISIYYLFTARENVCISSQHVDILHSMIYLHRDLQSRIFSPSVN